MNLAARGRLLAESWSREKRQDRVHFPGDHSMYDKRYKIFMAYTGEVSNPVKYAVNPILTFIAMVILFCLNGYLLLHLIEPHIIDTVIELINKSYPFEVYR